jgi:hypothetical protein
MSEISSAKPKQNLYLVLDLGPGASQVEILHAYNRAKNTYSEDSVASYAVFDDESKEEILKEIEFAFSILGNPSKRREYDVKMGFDTWKEDAHDKPKSGPTVLASLSRPAGIASVTTSAQAPTFAKKINPNIQVVNNTYSKKDFVPNPDFETKIHSCTDLTGEFIKAVRIYRQMSEDELATRIRLSPGHIASIENELGEHLHHPVYLRGHVVLICQALGIPNEQNLVKSFIERLKKENKLSKVPSLS